MGYEDFCGYYFWVTTKQNYFWGVISTFLVFYKVKVQNGNILVGYAKISNIFWSMPDNFLGKQ